MFYGPHSEEAKSKISEAFSGEKHPLWGTHPSEESREKMSKSHKGQIPWNKGKTFSEEYRKKLSESHKGIFPSEETKKKLSEVRKGHPGYMKGKKHSEEARRKMSLAGKGRKKSDEHLKKIMQSNGMKPSKPELELGDLLTEIFPGEYRYVGNGEFVIGGKCPDFINVNGKKKIIELFGDYWHRGENPQDRIDVFKPFGFETIVIWESELKDKEKLVYRLTLTDADLDLNG